MDDLIFASATRLARLIREKQVSSREVVDAIGVQIVARPWREDVALAVARRIEAALGGWQRPPL